MENLIDFQNMLNETYTNDAEPIDQVKVKDICVAFHDSDWCRCEVIGITTNRFGKMRITVYLIDSGRTVVKKKEKLFMLKGPHNAIAPYAIKCQLSKLSSCDLNDSEQSMVQEQFERFSNGNHEVCIYVNELVTDSRPRTYDVLLFTDIQANINTAYQAYLLQEVYGAFILPKIRFDNETCAEWSTNIHHMATDSRNDFSKKEIIFLSHVVSPMEIYIKSKSAKMAMSEIRRRIEAYVAQIYFNDDIDSMENQMQRHTAEWSIGSDCLARVQSWKTQTMLKLWFRGRIIAIDSETSTITVFLRDSGRNFEVNNVDVMTISAELAAPDDAVQKSHLAISNVWLESSTDLLFSVLEEYKFFAVSLKSCDDENDLAVTLWATNASPPNPNHIEIWDNVSLRLISQSIKASMEKFIKKSQRKYKFQSRDNSDTIGSSDVNDLMKFLHVDDLSQSALKPIKDANNVKMDCYEDWLHQGRLVHKWPSPIPIDGIKFIGMVTHINDKGIIYVQQESNIEAVDQLDQSITKFIGDNFDSNVTKNWPWHKGDTCFAEFNNGCYHRAVIKKIIPERAICLVN